MTHQGRPRKAQQCFVSFSWILKFILWKYCSVNILRIFKLWCIRSIFFCKLKINVKPSLQKPNSEGALQRITFTLLLWLNPTTYMRSYWLVSFAGHYVLPFDGVTKEMNSCSKGCLNFYQNIHSSGRGPCNTSKFYLF